MKLITEENFYDAKYLIEEKNGKKNYYIEGIFLQGEIVNHNGRKYPISLLDREVARYTKENIENKTAMGELGHPTTPTVNLDRVSHLITSLKKEGNNYFGRAKLLDTPMGNIAKNLIEEGVTLGVSSRGLGTMKNSNEGYQIVSDDFHLAVGADIVATPSAPEAFVQGVFEGAEWIFNPTAGTWMESRMENIKKQVRASMMTEQKKAQAFKSFLDGISQLKSDY